MLHAHGKNNIESPKIGVGDVSVWIGRTVSLFV